MTKYAIITLSLLGCSSSNLSLSKPVKEAPHFHTSGNTGGIVVVNLEKDGTIGLEWIERSLSKCELKDIVFSKGGCVLDDVYIKPLKSNQ